MRILVTGATGFLGSHLCRRLSQQGHRVTALRRPTSSLAALAGVPVEEVVGDLTDAASVQRAVARQDMVVHAAADIAMWGPRGAAQARVNIEGTQSVAAACRVAGVRRLLHVSSVAAIGIPSDPGHPADEAFRFNLERSGLAYHLSKWRAEQEVLAEVARGLDAVIVNPGSLFGPLGDGYRGGEMIEKARRTPIVPYFRGGLNVVHVEDVVAAAVEALARGQTGERYILGGENLTYRRLAELAAAGLGVRRLFVPVPRLVTGIAAAVLDPAGRLLGRRPRFTREVHYCAAQFSFYDSSKASRELGFAPRGFHAVVQEYRRQRLR